MTTPQHTAPDVPRRAWPDRSIGDLAARQATILTSRQLTELGVRRRTVGAALERGRLHRVHHGVYSLVPEAARPRWAPEWAALLACGPHAMLSHGSAAGLHGFEVARSESVELTIVGADRGRGRDGLRVHRTAALHPQEVVRIGRMPASSPARVAIELSPRMSDPGLARLVDEVLRRTSRARLLETLDRHARQPGTPRVRAALDPARPSADTWSKAEARLLALVSGAGLPAPEANVPVGPYRPDLLWRQQRVIVDYDSLEFHAGTAKFTPDRVRRNDLTIWGYQVLNVTWEMLSAHPERVLVWIATALARAA